MSRAGAERDRYERESTSPSNPRRYQAADYSSGSQAYSDSRDYEALEQEDPEGQMPSSAQRQEQRQAQHLGAYRVIPPNPTKRNQLQKIANKELEDLAKWKEQNRPGLITLTPQKLGGTASEAEVRQMQQLQHIQSKYQQKLKKEEYERIKREAEEVDLLKKKAIQREKANKLEDKRRQQEWQRRQLLEEDHYLKTTGFLNRLDLGPPFRSSYQTGYNSLETSAWARGHTYRELQRQEENRRLQEMKEEQRRKAELLELKQRQEERTRINERQRVNNAFLDRLQSNSQPGGIYQSGRLGNMGFSADGWEPEYFQ